MEQIRTTSTARTSSPRGGAVRHGRPLHTVGVRRGRVGRPGRGRPCGRRRPARLRRGALAPDGVRRARRLLHRFADLVRAQRRARARRHRDMGKPITDARDQGRAADRAELRFFADHARLVDRRGLPDGHRPPCLLAVPARRRGRRDLAVELPADAGVLEGRARARLGQHGGAQARRGHPAVGDAAGPARAPRPACRPACSTSCTASARTPRARRSPSTAASTGSPSPASPAPAGPSARPPRPT